MVSAVGGAICLMVLFCVLWYKCARVSRLFGRNEPEFVGINPSPIATATPGGPASRLSMNDGDVCPTCLGPVIDPVLHNDGNAYCRTCINAGPRSLPMNNNYLMPHPALDMVDKMANESPV